MGDAGVGIAIEALVKMADSLHQILLTWRLKKCLTQLARDFEKMQAFLYDAQSKRITSQYVQCWLKDLDSIALDAQITLEESEYEIQRQKVERAQKWSKVRPFFPSSTPLVFRWRLARRIKNVRSSLQRLFAQAHRIGLKPLEYINSLPDLKVGSSTNPFVKDSKIVGRKGDISKVWMAHGLLNPPKGSLMEMEDVGSLYCDVLLRNSLFQIAKKDRYNNIKAYKIHNLVHDDLLKVLGNDYFHVDDSMIKINRLEAVHISISSSEMRIWNILKGIFPSSLRTLNLEGYLFPLPEDAFENLTNLSVLILKGHTTLPNSVGKIKHLRFLDIRLGQLENLQFLSYFVVGKADGCQIKELEYLDNLRDVRILNLQCLRSHESAAKSKLSNKSNIQCLELKWNRGPGRDDCDVLEVKSNSRNDMAITLFPALRTLVLQQMWDLEEWSDVFELIPTTHSSSFSSASVQVRAFPLLEKMDLWNLPELRGFPNLGSLPRLQKLHLQRCQKLRIFHDDLNRGPGHPQKWENDDQRQGNTPEDGDDESHIYFPRLRKLKISQCNKFTEPFCSLISSSVPLESLNIDCKPSLWPRVLLRFTSLRRLSLGARWDEQEVDRLTWPCPTISHATSYCFSLLSLELNAYGLKTSLPYHIQNVTSLTDLSITGVHGLKTLPKWLGSLERLQHLTISDCKDLKELPSAKTMHRLTKLQTLRVFKCERVGKWQRWERSHMEFSKIIQLD
ncbi:OLC1v1006591C1 [Oldenlandia corymbosa var. corymbosa]|uniref:OLC1v1006591C1 n=1 Tax=Oldenlandia corymbosa var. corymbosa TaxID=529605 RepID=A0AAV1DHC9_OLDCO|nr:OLC1v1006591C1 [Oldenlandia corymbosa var. corymbosa]